MRTTLDIDEDVLYAAKELAHSRHVSAGKVISELAREGFMKRASRHRTRNGIPQLPIKPDGKIVTLELVNKLRDEYP